MAGGALSGGGWSFSVSRPFVSEFLLPLVQGGIVEVGRPVAVRDVQAWVNAESTGRLPAAERRAIAALNQARRRALFPLVAAPPALALDEDSWRLGAAVHNLLALSHPGIAAGAGAQSRVERVAAAAAALGNLGAPTSLTQALARHSLLARLPDVARFDHTVRFWLGRRTFVGRRPPARMLALPRLRQVRVESVRRGWLKDVGVQAAARPAFAALTEASPLGEALDPLRLDPPWSWGRVLSILKFPSLCRLVAGRLLDLGWARSGDALAGALYRYVSLQDITGPVLASAEAVTFALGFLAHLTWLDYLFEARPASGGRAPGGMESSAARGGGDGGAGSGPAARGEDAMTVGEAASASLGASPPSGAVSALPPASAVESGREVTALLFAAHELSPPLVWPADVRGDSQLGQGFARHLEFLFDRHDAQHSPRRTAAADLVRLAMGGAWPRVAGDAV